MRGLYISGEGGGGGGGTPLPSVKRHIVALIVLGGVAAFSLSVAAEFTRTSKYQILENALGQLQCYYQPSQATILASVATAALLFSQMTASIAGGFSWSRPLFQRHMADNKAMVGRAVQKVTIVLIMNTLFLLAAWGVLIAAAVENKYHVSETPYGQLFMQCSVVSEGIFLSAAVLSAIAAVLMAAYYVYATRANEELWLCNYVAAPVVVDMEAFSRETARTSITSIIQDKRGEGGKTSAISNTPISHARLA